MTGPAPQRSRFAPFVGVGAIGFAVDASILTLLASGFGWSNYAARAVSFPLAITVTWLCNRNWVFARTNDARREYATWVLTQIAGATINLGGYASLLALFPSLESFPVIALIGGGILALLFNYFAARRWVFTAAAAIALIGGTGLDLRAQPAAGPSEWRQPRTSWGDPDLEGVWTTDNNFSIPLERPPEVAAKEFLDGAELEAALAERAKLIDAVANGGAVGAGPSHWYENLQARSHRSSLIVEPKDGRLPALTAGARERIAAEQAARARRGPADSYRDLSLWDRCISVGLPAVMFPTGYNNNVRILQAPGYVTITHEMMHDTRVVPLDGSAHLPPQFRHYLGDSRGRFEGDTLVIDVTNFRPETNYRGSRETLHLTERYTRTGADRMRYEVTIADAQTWERPWTAVLDLEPQGDIYEYACHEGNLGLENILRAARFEEARESAATK